MTNSYRKAYTEVLEILSHFSEEEYSKIPEEKINFYKEHMDKDYIYKIDPKVDLSKQYISREANAILVSLFRDYFATESQKKKLNNLLWQNQQKQEEIKKEKYNTENFLNTKEIEKNVKKNEVEIVEYKESFFSKFIAFMKRILKL